MLLFSRSKEEFISCKTAILSGHSLINYVVSDQCIAMCTRWCLISEAFPILVLVSEQLLICNERHCLWTRSGCIIQCWWLESNYWNNPLVASSVTVQKCNFLGQNYKFTKKNSLQNKKHTLGWGNEMCAHMNSRFICSVIKKKRLVE